MPRAAFFCKDINNIDFVYALERRQQLEDSYSFFDMVVTPDNIEEHLDALPDLEYIFSTWGMWRLSEEQLDRLPQLKAVFYAAGSVKGFAETYLDRNIVVMSAWAANAIPVAEYTLAQVILAGKQYWQCIRQDRRKEARKLLKGNFDQSLALIGAGMIGRKVIELLRPFSIKVSIVDPFISDDEATAMGVRKVSLEEAFAGHQIVSNHLPNIPETVGLLRHQHFASMPEGATFINTGRGAQVVESELQSVLQVRPDLTALLDVTFPEPPEEGSLFYTLDNVVLTPHIAGSLGLEVVRMADYAIEEAGRYDAGEHLQYAVTKDMLKHMA